MSDTTATRDREPNRPRTTIADIVRDLEPMGDLSRFAVDDLTAEDEDKFFGILEDA